MKNLNSSGIQITVSFNPWVILTHPTKNSWQKQGNSAQRHGGDCSKQHTCCAVLHIHRANVLLQRSGNPTCKHHARHHDLHINSFLSFGTKVINVRITVTTKHKAAPISYSFLVSEFSYSSLQSHLLIILLLTSSSAFCLCAPSVFFSTCFSFISLLHLAYVSLQFLFFPPSCFFFSAFFLLLAFLSICFTFSVLWWPNNNLR
jgi:hypothetical protein